VSVNCEFLVSVNCEFVVSVNCEFLVSVNCESLVCREDPCLAPRFMSVNSGTTTTSERAFVSAFCLKLVQLIHLRVMCV